MDFHKRQRKTENTGWQMKMVAMATYNLPYGTQYYLVGLHIDMFVQYLQLAICVVLL
jgi:hypothetical protein